MDEMDARFARQFNPQPPTNSVQFVGTYRAGEAGMPHAVESVQGEAPNVNPHDKTAELEARLKVVEARLAALEARAAPAKMADREIRKHH